MKNETYKSSIFFYAAMIAAAFLLGAYIFGAMNQRHDTAFSWYAAPRLLDTDLKPITTVVPGQPVVMVYSIARNSERCWASSTEYLDGVVDVQFNHTVSQVFESRKTEFEVRQMFTIPEGVPPGKYRWKSIVYPQCDGEAAAPMNKDTGIIIEVTPKVRPTK